MRPIYKASIAVGLTGVVFLILLQVRIYLPGSLQLFLFPAEPIAYYYVGAHLADIAGVIEYVVYGLLLGLGYLMHRANSFALAVAAIHVLALLVITCCVHFVTA